MILCPTYNTRVLPKPDGTCPSCQVLKGGAKITVYETFNAPGM
jgi:hypothetical protein